MGAAGARRRSSHSSARRRKRRKSIIPSERPVFGLPGEKSGRREHVLRVIFHPKGLFFGLPGEKSGRRQHVLREIFHPKGRFLAFRGKSPAGAHASRPSNLHTRSTKYKSAGFTSDAVILILASFRRNTAVLSLRRKAETHKTFQKGVKR